MFLGLVQGLTEFLPVSSSGHLVLFQQWFDLELSPDVELLLDTILHLGTLVAVFVVFRGELVGLLKAIPAPFRLGWRTAWRENGMVRLWVWLIVGTIPAGVAGVALEDLFTEAFGSPLAVGGALLVTAAVLLSSLLARTLRTPLGEMNVVQAISIGVAQALAITPGISRSGTTIVAGLHVGLDREAAGRFSFLLAIPAILGATVLQLLKIEYVPDGFAPAAIVGFATAAISGYFALRILLRFVRQGRLHWFGIYCILAAVCAFTLA